MKWSSVSLSTFSLSTTFYARGKYVYSALTVASVFLVVVNFFIIPRLSTLMIGAPAGNGQRKWTTSDSSFVGLDNYSWPCEFDDFTTGKWVPRDGIQYRNRITQHCAIDTRQDCRGGASSYRWSGSGSCPVRHFDAAKFISCLRNTRLTFIGDSLARNQFESLLCLLAVKETVQVTSTSYDTCGREVSMHTKTAVFLRNNMTLSHTYSHYMIANVPCDNESYILQKCGPSVDIASQFYIVVSLRVRSQEGA